MLGRPLLLAACASLALLLEQPGGLAAATAAAAYEATTAPTSRPELHQIQRREAKQVEGPPQESREATTAVSASAAPTSQGGPAEQVPPYMQHMTLILVCLHLSVFVTGLVGNSLVCLSVLRNKSLQTVTNYYIVNLAVADFLVILICLPPTVYWDLTLTWNFGLILCKLVLYLQSISVSVSVLTLTCISIDRWYAICRPLEFSSTKYRAKITICLIWLLSMLIGSPDAIFLTTKPLYEEDNYVYTDCTYSWPEWNTKIYQLCIVSLLFVGPFVLMSISYSHIVNVLWHNELSAIQSEESADYGNMGPSSAPAKGSPPAASNQHQRQHRHHQSGCPKRADTGRKGRPAKKRNEDTEQPHGTNNNSMTAVELLSAGGPLDGQQQQQRQPAIVDGRPRQIDLKQTNKQQQTEPAACEIATTHLPDDDSDEPGTCGPAKGAGNELANCLVFAGELAPTSEVAPAPGQRPSQCRSQAKRDEKPTTPPPTTTTIKKKLIPNESSARHSKSSRNQLSGPTRASNQRLSGRGGRSNGDDDASNLAPEGAADDQSQCWPTGGAPATIEAKNQGPNVAEASCAGGNPASSQSEPLRGAARSSQGARRCCCGLLLGRTHLESGSELDLEPDSANHGDLAAASSRAPAKLAPSQSAAAAGAKSGGPTAIIMDGTTSKRYRRNLANYAAKRAKYRPAGTAGAKGQASKLMPASSSSQLAVGISNNGSLAEETCSNPQNNSQQQQQQQQTPNYLSPSSSNNARFYKLIESRKKAAKMLIVIVIMFGLCYLPIHFLNILRYTIGLPQNDITTIASLVSHWLCYFNSAINPLIYNFMSGKFRKEFANLFFCRCFRRHGQT